ncbi:MAG: transcriptional repressor [Muribaculaceae bacterium]|nr:transcriptional repressor [Bacteroidales bacterium]MDE6242544.1 transcriptional repressor [Muribaculaceae bacterium]
MNDVELMMDNCGLKPTSNRILVLRTLLNSPCPQSLGDLEKSLGTLDKSSILRVLTILLEHHLIHSLEDGRGVIKYEICHAHHEDRDMDMHVHFYCEQCRSVKCFEDIPVPPITLPDNYAVQSVNYMVKGICPDCAKKA